MFRAVGEEIARPSVNYSGTYVTAYFLTVDRVTVGERRTDLLVLVNNH